MTDPQRNFLDMVKAVDAIYEIHKAVIDAVVARMNAFAKHKINTQAVEEAAGQQSQDTTGVAKDKAEQREVLNSIMYGMTQTVSAYASSISNNTLRDLMNHSLTEIERITDESIGGWAQIRLDKINEIVASLADWDIDADAITEAQDAIDDYDSAKDAPRVAQVQKKGHTGDLKERITAGRQHLKEIMDPLMNNLRFRNTTVYTAYKNARMIIDRGKGGSGEAEPEAPE